MQCTYKGFDNDYVDSYGKYNLTYTGETLCYESEKSLFTIKQEQPNLIFFQPETQNEMIRVTKEGFYIRGIKVEQDEKEAETVYNAFKKLLGINNES